MGSGNAVAVTLLLSLILIAANVTAAFGLSHLLIWLYFDVGVRWTSDPVVPQIQAFLAPIVQCITALIYVPIGLALRSTRSMAFGVALVWPPVSGLLALLGSLGLFLILVLTWPVVVLLGIRRDRQGSDEAQAATSRTGHA